MKYKETRTGIRDRSAWGRGPWDDEPDYAHWIDEKTGLPCLVVRNNLGGLCGYVGVGAPHAMYENDYALHYDIHVHGGLTYSDACQGMICHDPEEGEDHVWWFGFDCAHAGDSAPSIGISNSRDTYRDMAYVISEVEDLARQLKEREEDV